MKCDSHEYFEPTDAEVEQYNMTCLFFWAWCLACVEGKARDMLHRRQEGEYENMLPDFVVAYCSLGVEGEETIAI